MKEYYILIHIIFYGYGHGHGVLHDLGPFLNETDRENAVNELTKVYEARGDFEIIKTLYEKSLTTKTNIKGLK